MFFLNKIIVLVITTIKKIFNIGLQVSGLEINELLFFAITLTILVEDISTAVSSVTDNVTTFDLTQHPEVVRQSGVVNTAVPGTYRILYEVEDEAGNLATEVVAVTVTPGA